MSDKFHQTAESFSSFVASSVFQAVPNKGEGLFSLIKRPLSRVCQPLDLLEFLSMNRLQIYAANEFIDNLRNERLETKDFSMQFNQNAVDKSQAPGASLFSEVVNSSRIQNILQTKQKSIGQKRNPQINEEDEKSGDEEDEENEEEEHYSLIHDVDDDRADSDLSITFTQDKDEKKRREQQGDKEGGKNIKDINDIEGIDDIENVKAINGIEDIHGVEVIQGDNKENTIGPETIGRRVSAKTPSASPLSDHNSTISEIRQASISAKNFSTASPKNPDRTSLMDFAPKKVFPGDRRRSANPAAPLLAKRRGGSLRRMTEVDGPIRPFRRRKTKAGTDPAPERRFQSAVLPLVQKPGSNFDVGRKSNQTGLLDSSRVESPAFAISDRVYSARGDSPRGGVSDHVDSLRGGSAINGGSLGSSSRGWSEKSRPLDTSSLHSPSNTNKSASASRSIFQPPPPAVEFDQNESQQSISGDSARGRRDSTRGRRDSSLKVLVVPARDTDSFSSMLQKKSSPLGEFDLPQSKLRPATGISGSSRKLSHNTPKIRVISTSEQRGKSFSIEKASELGQDSPPLVIKEDRRSQLAVISKSELDKSVSGDFSPKVRYSRKSAGVGPRPFAAGGIGGLGGESQVAVGGGSRQLVAVADGGEWLASSQRSDENFSEFIDSVKSIIAPVKLKQSLTPSRFAQFVADLNAKKTAVIRREISQSLQDLGVLTGNAEPIIGDELAVFPIRKKHSQPKSSKNDRTFPLTNNTLGIDSPSMTMSIRAPSMALTVGAPSIAIEAPSLNIEAPSMGIDSPSNIMAIDSPSMAIDSPLNTKTLCSPSIAIAIGSPSIAYHAKSEVIILKSDEVEVFDVQNTSLLENRKLNSNPRKKSPKSPDLAPSEDPDQNSKDEFLDLDSPNNNYEAFEVKVNSSKQKSVSSSEEAGYSPPKPIDFSISGVNSPNKKTKFSLSAAEPLSPSNAVCFPNGGGDDKEFDEMVNQYTETLQPHMQAINHMDLHTDLAPIESIDNPDQLVSDTDREDKDVYEPILNPAQPIPDELANNDIVDRENVEGDIRIDNGKEVSEKVGDPVVELADDDENDIEIPPLDEKISRLIERQPEIFGEGSHRLDQDIALENIGDDGDRGDIDYKGNEGDHFENIEKSNSLDQSDKQDKEEIADKDIKKYNQDKGDKSDSKNKDLKEDTEEIIHNVYKEDPIDKDEKVDKIVRQEELEKGEMTETKTTPIDDIAPPPNKTTCSDPKTPEVQNPAPLSPSKSSERNPKDKNANSLSKAESHQIDSRDIRECPGDNRVGTGNLLIETSKNETEINKNSTEEPIPESPIHPHQLDIDNIETPSLSLKKNDNSIEDQASHTENTTPGTLNTGQKIKEESNTFNSRDKESKEVTDLKREPQRETIAVKNEPTAFEPKREDSNPKKSNKEINSQKSLRTKTEKSKEEPKDAKDGKFKLKKQNTKEKKGDAQKSEKENEKADEKISEPLQSEKNKTEVKNLGGEDPNKEKLVDKSSDVSKIKEEQSQLKRLHSKKDIDQSIREHPKVIEGVNDLGKLREKSTLNINEEKNTVQEISIEQYFDLPSHFNLKEKKEKILPDDVKIEEKISDKPAPKEKKPKSKDLEKNEDQNKIKRASITKPTDKPTKKDTANIAEQSDLETKKVIGATKKVPEEPKIVSENKNKENEPMIIEQKLASKIPSPSKNDITGENEPIQRKSFDKKSLSENKRSSMKKKDILKENLEDISINPPSQSEDSRMSQEISVNSRNGGNKLNIDTSGSRGKNVSMSVSSEADAEGEGEEFSFLQNSFVKPQPSFLVSNPELIDKKRYRPVQTFKLAEIELIINCFRSRQMIFVKLSAPSFDFLFASSRKIRCLILPRMKPKVSHFASISSKPTTLARFQKDSPIDLGNEKKKSVDEVKEEVKENLVASELTSRHEDSDKSPELETSQVLSSFSPNKNQQKEEDETEKKQVEEIEQEKVPDIIEPPLIPTNPSPPGLKVPSELSKGIFSTKKNKPQNIFSSRPEASDSNAAKRSLATRLASKTFVKHSGPITKPCPIVSMTKLDDPFRLTNSMSNHNPHRTHLGHFGQKKTSHLANFAARTKDNWTSPNSHLPSTNMRVLLPKLELSQTANNIKETSPGIDELEILGQRPSSPKQVETKPYRLLPSGENPSGPNLSRSKDSSQVYVNIVVPKPKTQRQEGSTKQTGLRLPEIIQKRDRNHSKKLSNDRLTLDNKENKGQSSPVNGENRGKSNDKSPYELSVTNQGLRKNYNLEIVLSDGKESTMNPNVFEMKYKVVKYHKAAKS